MNVTCPVVWLAGVTEQVNPVPVLPPPLQAESRMPVLMALRERSKKQAERRKAEEQAKKAAQEEQGAQRKRQEKLAQLAARFNAR